MNTTNKCLRVYLLLRTFTDQDHTLILKLKILEKASRIPNQIEHVLNVQAQLGCIDHVDFPTMHECSASTFEMRIDMNLFLFRRDAWVISDGELTTYTSTVTWETWLNLSLEDHI
jgi:hypothetical protein